MKSFGRPQLAMLVRVEVVYKLFIGLVVKVKKALTEQGYYLQLPPPPENLLKQHLEVSGKK